MKKHKTKKAFTLVELIIVISILAILATIAFMSFQNYTKDSRDGNRLATITNINKWLNLFQLQTGKYPQPEWTIINWYLETPEWGSILYSDLGIIWETITKQIKMNTLPLDPLTKNNYVYATTNDGSSYQVATALEKLSTRTFPLIEQTYADSWYQAKVMWNHELNVKFLSGANTYFTVVPSMLFVPDEETLKHMLNTSDAYSIVNGGKNLPYWFQNTYNSKVETNQNIIQFLRKDPQAKMLTLNITDIVNTTWDTRLQKIREIFWTWTDMELYPWITSKNILWTFGIQVLSGQWEWSILNDIESVIVWKAPAPRTSAQCWTGAKLYTHSETAYIWWNTSFCSLWTPDPELPAFPNHWTEVSWNCISPDGGGSASCTASRANPDEEIKECSWKPTHSKYFNASDTHSVIVPFWTSAPNPTYHLTPSENSCDFACDSWYTHEDWNCIDKTAPSGWNFTIPTSTTSTTVLLNITCPTDEIDGSNIEMYISGSINTSPVWETCTSSKNITITSTDDIKTIQMKWRDASGNQTAEVTKTMSYILYTFTNHTFTTCWVSWRNWPTLAQCRTAYNSTTWASDNNFFAQSHAQWIQLWTVPQTGWYRIDVYGAAGWIWTATYIWWLWAQMRWDFYLIKWQKLKILVGQKWEDNASYKSWWWWWWTFVTNDTNTPLIIAWWWWWWWWNSSPRSWQPWLIWTSGGNWSQWTAIWWTNWNGWAAASWWWWWAGLIWNWFNGYISNGWMSFTNWWVWWQKWSCAASTSGWDGGFGWWWGGEWCNMWATWWWGGYSWWASTSSNWVAWWWGSFRATTYNSQAIQNTSWTEWVRSWHGQVIITKL